MFEFKTFDSLTNGEIDLILDCTTLPDDDLGYVPSYKFHIVYHGKNEPIGKIDIRIGHNENTYYGGNIGYEVFENHRGNHYAGKACKLLKEVARSHDLDKLYITCNPDNIGSRKTCEYIGLEFIGVLDVPTHNEMHQRGEKQKCIYEWKLK